MAENERSYRFGEFRLDPAAARLVRGEQDIELPPKAFQVLAYLVEHRERVVPKQQLVETIWRDTFVTDDALVQAITTIRRALGDSAEEPRFIRTRPRLGYQFIAPVRSDSQPVSAARPAVPTSIAPIGRTGARRLMIAIQAGYLLLYSIALFQLEVAAGALTTTLLRPAGLAALALPLLVVLALVGVTVRLYLITTVALDH
ncbi:MAG: transcriptional regulator, partial [Terriglobia bacterium]